MADLTLQTFTGKYHFKYRIDLDGIGTEHELRFHFSPKDEQADGTDGAWYLDVLDAAGVPVIYGLKLSLGTDKLALVRYRDNAPQGRLDVIDSTGLGLEASSDDLGKRVVVEYWR